MFLEVPKQAGYLKSNKKIFHCLQKVNCHVPMFIKPLGWPTPVTTKHSSLSQNYGRLWERLPFDQNWACLKHEMAKL